MVKKNETIRERFVRIFKSDSTFGGTHDYGLILNRPRTAGYVVEDDKRWNIYNLGRLEVKSPKPKGDYRIWDSSFRRGIVNKALTVLKCRKYVDTSVAVGNHDKLSSTYFLLVLSSGKDKIFLAPALLGKEEEFFKDFPRDLAKMITKITT
jgi:hypothetical protein